MKFTSPKGKVNRALGFTVYENRGAVKALERREYKPGMHGRAYALSSCPGIRGYDDEIAKNGKAIDVTPLQIAT